MAPRIDRAANLPDLTLDLGPVGTMLKTWGILRKLRCCPWRAGQIAKAIHVLQTREIAG